MFTYQFLQFLIVIVSIIACSANRRYLSYSEGDFEVFCPRGATCSTDGVRFEDVLAVKIWVDLLKGLWSYDGFKLRGLGLQQIFSAF